MQQEGSPEPQTSVPPNTSHYPRSYAEFSIVEKMLKPRKKFNLVFLLLTEARQFRLAAVLESPGQQFSKEAIKYRRPDSRAQTAYIMLSIKVLCIKQSWRRADSSPLHTGQTGGTSSDPKPRYPGRVVYRRYSHHLARDSSLLRTSRVCPEWCGGARSAEQSGGTKLSCATLNRKLSKFYYYVLLDRV